MHLPVTGHPLHTRSLTLRVAAADNGRWAAHGEIIDLRKTGFAPLYCDLQPAGIIHHMTIDLLVDPATLVIETLLAAQPVVAVEPSPRSCGESCREPVAALNILVGAALDDDFRGKLSRAFGGPRGCSHLLSLFQYMARAIPRAALYAQRLQTALNSQHEIGEPVFQSSLFVDGFQTPKREFELTLQIGDCFLRPEQEAESALSRFAYDNAARVFTRIDPAAMSLADTVVATRERDYDSLDRPWQEQAEWAARVDGHPIIGGLGSHVAQAYDADPDARVLQDGLSQLAPGYIQILAAVADEWIAGGRDSDANSSERPLGASVDSCYIWREGSQANGATFS